jgi:hypothetical protein
MIIEQGLTILAAVGGLLGGGGILKLVQVIARRKTRKATTFQLLTENMVSMSNELRQWANMTREKAEKEIME